MVTNPIHPLTKRIPLARQTGKDPQFFCTVRRASGQAVKAADPRATRAMVALMDMNAVMGGAASHWGGPSAFAELMSAVHAIMFQEADERQRPWFELFGFVNDGGHCENGLYALKANYEMAGVNLQELKKFRSIESRLTGHGESHLFPEGVWISNGPLGSAFPQSQGLAYGDFLAGRERVTVTALTDGAAMEGEAREAFAAIPGLAQQGKLAPYVLIISDNNTKLTGRIDEESFSMAATFSTLGELGWKVIELKEAHNLQSCVTTIDQAIHTARKNPRQPVAIHARTIKGYGIKKTADSSSGGHGFPLKKPDELGAFLQEIYSNEEVPKVFLEWAEELVKSGSSIAPKSPYAEIRKKIYGDQKTDKVQVGVAKALIKMREKGLPIFSVSADLPGSTGVAGFQKQYPDNTQDIGVAESNMVSMAAGLAKQGFIPVVDTFAQFGVTKGALPLTMAALSQAPVIAIFSHVGFQDAADGASHQALTYFAMTSSIPHTEVYALTCAEEADSLVTQAIERYAEQMSSGQIPSSVVFFLGRENFNLSYGAKDYKLGRAQVVRDCDKPQAVIAATGALLDQALVAAEMLSQDGVEAAVLNPSVIHKPDVATFSKYLQNCRGRLITVEDHQVIGGMGAILSHALSTAGVSLKLTSLGVQGEFGQSAYTAEQLYQKHGLDAAAIAKAVRP